jgi:CheY-like chemotaxis protein
VAQPNRVLIVDDEPHVRILLTRWVTQWGYAVREAASAAEALNVMAADPADIVLCDIRMPEHDGLWLAEHVHTRWPHTALIISTGLDAPQIVRTSRVLGAVAYVLKPFNSELLREALDRASGRLHYRPSVI